MELIDGNKIAAVIIAELKAEVATITGRKPCIALVRIDELRPRAAPLAATSPAQPALVTD